jgi:hypothetical protein
VRRLEPGIVHCLLDRIDELRLLEVPVEWRAAGVPEQRGGENVVVALQPRQHQLPCPPGVGEAVQAYHRRPGATSRRWRERGEHARKTYGLGGSIAHAHDDADRSRRRRQGEKVADGAVVAAERAGELFGQ